MLFASVTWAGLALYLVVGAVVATAGAYFFGPKWLSDLIASTLRIKTRAALESTTTKIQRAEDRITVLSNTIEEEDRKLSDAKGTLNHQRNILKRVTGERDEAENNWNLLMDAGKPANVVQPAKDALDAKESELSTQQTIVKTHEDAVDASRTAIDTARREIAKLANQVKSSAAKAKATQAIKNAARVIEETKHLATNTAQLAKDLDGIDEEFEQAQEQLNRVKPQTTETDKALAELKQKQQSDRNASGAPDLNTPEGRRAARLAATPVKS